MTLVVEDWRGLDRATMLALYDREYAAWRRHLAWETAGVWQTVEQARTGWGLPGLAAIDPHGRVAAWTFYLPEDGLLTVGGFQADTAEAAEALVDALDRDARQRPARLSWFVYERAPRLAPLLAARGMTVEPYWYLSAAAWNGPASARGAGASRDWRDTDVPAAAALLVSSYAGMTAPAAPGNRLDEWARHVDRLVRDGSLGTLMPDASRVVSEGDAMQGLVLATRLGPHTAHVAQVAIAPSRRRRGLAGALIDDMRARAAARGCTRVTLLVGASNRPALALYDRLGFRPVATFLSVTDPRAVPQVPAVTSAPVRATEPACVR